MSKLLSFTLLVLFSGHAVAEPGSGTDRTSVNLQVEAMKQDGRWEQLLAAGRANKEAFEALRQAEQRMQQPALSYSSTGAARALRRQ